LDGPFISKSTESGNFQLRSKDVNQEATIEEDGGMGMGPIKTGRKKSTSDVK
jgi:hypothetical protein